MVGQKNYEDVIKMKKEYLEKNPEKVREYHICTSSRKIICWDIGMNG